MCCASFDVSLLRKRFLCVSRFFSSVALVELFVLVFTHMSHTTIERVLWFRYGIFVRLIHTFGTFVWLTMCCRFVSRERWNNANQNRHRMKTNSNDFLRSIETAARSTRCSCWSTSWERRSHRHHIRKPISVMELFSVKFFALCLFYFILVKLVPQIIEKLEWIWEWFHQIRF